MEWIQLAQDRASCGKYRYFNGTSVYMKGLEFQSIDQTSVSE